MNTKTLTQPALKMIEQYLHFTIGSTSCSVPYFNNKTTKARAGLRAYSGKGSPSDIFEEVQTLMIKSHVAIDSLTSESLKKVLTDQNLGIDCSGFVYYILNAEFAELKKSTLNKHISFVNRQGFFGKIRAKLRPVENCDVSTLAHDTNSSLISTKDILPGDIITLINQKETSNTDRTERNHILVIHQVEYNDFIPTKLHYSHTIAYPEDGVYGSGIKQGVIEIIDVDKPITEQIWTENGKQNEENQIFVRAKKSMTEVRRVN